LAYSLLSAFFLQAQVYFDISLVKEMFDSMETF